MGDRLQRYREKRTGRSGEPTGSGRRGHRRKKLRGGWTLQRTHGGHRPQWLLIKRRDEAADARRNPQSTQPGSVLTGRTIEQVATEEDP